MFCRICTSGSACSCLAVLMFLDLFTVLTCLPELGFHFHPSVFNRHEAAEVCKQTELSNGPHSKASLFGPIYRNCLWFKILFLFLQVSLNWQTLRNAALWSPHTCFTLIWLQSSEGLLCTENVSTLHLSSCPAAAEGASDYLHYQPIIMKLITFWRVSALHDENASCTWRNSGNHGRDIALAG